MKIYADFNILGRLVDQFNDSVPPSNDPNWELDHKALESIWGLHLENSLRLISCTEDCLEEFGAFAPDIMNNYGKIKTQLSGEMLEKFKLFEQLEKGDLLIAPWGDYGYGCGPWGGGDPKHYELLDVIRKVLQRPDPENSQKDRDARHLMHCVLYRCDYFLTMDYRMVNKLNSPSKSFIKYMTENGYVLKTVTPSELLSFLDR